MELRTVRYEDNGAGTVTLTLNRPESLNAFNLEMIADLDTGLSTAERDSACRVVVITGAGRAFSAGGDVKGFNAREFNGDHKVPMFFRHDLPDLTARVEHFRKPVIAALNGVAVGEGVEIALAADFRVASTSARLGFPEVNIGVIPASGGCSRIVKYVGLMRAKELFLRGAMLSASEAAAAGLVSHVVSDDDLATSAQALADELAAKAPLSMAMTKAVLNRCVDTDKETGHMLEFLAQCVLVKTDDHIEGVEAFLQKRPPKWVGH